MVKNSVREKQTPKNSLLKSAGESILEIPKVSVNPVVSSDSLYNSVSSFKDSLLWRAIEQTALIGEDLQTKVDDATKLDMDSVNGQQVCQSFLQSIERTISVMGVNT